MTGKFVTAIAAALVAASVGFSAVDPAAAAQTIWQRGSGGRSTNFNAPRFNAPRFNAGRFNAPRFNAPRFNAGRFATPFGGANRFVFRHPFNAGQYRFNAGRYRFNAPRYGLANKFGPNAFTQNRQAMGYRHGRFEWRNFHLSGGETAG